MGMCPARDFDEAVENYKFAAGVYINNKNDPDSQNLMARAINDFIKFSTSEGKTVTFHSICNSPIPELLNIPFGSADDVCQLKMSTFRL